MYPLHSWFIFRLCKLCYLTRQVPLCHQIMSAFLSHFSLSEWSLLYFLYLFFILQIYINWMNFIVNLMLPLGALLFMNLSIYKGLQKLHGHSSTDNKERKKSSVVDFGASLLNNSEEEEERERDARFARASILMVVAFGLCHTPRLISNTVEMFIDHKDLPEVSTFCLLCDPPKNRIFWDFLCKLDGGLRKWDDAYWRHFALFWSYFVLLHLIREKANVSCLALGFITSSGCELM